jgi:hypothetical protein
MVNRCDVVENGASAASKSAREVDYLEASGIVTNFYT